MSLRRRLVPLVVGLAGFAGLLLVIQPSRVLASLHGTDLGLVGAAMLLTVAFYALQGVRWHFLLRAAGVRLHLHESVLINLAGQTVTAVIPLGDLTRALFATQATGVPFGATAATVTVQDLTFTSLLVLAATPALLGIPGGWLVSAIVLGGIAATLLILVVPGVYRPIRRLLGAVPLLRESVEQVDTLRRESVVLLTRPLALASGIIDLARVALAAGALELLLRAMNIQRGYWVALLVVAVAYVGGALSFLPGGIGANEASLIGVLVGFGVPAGQAAAVALLERLLLTGVPSVIGVLAYVAIHRRLHLGSLVASPRTVLTSASTSTSAAPATCEVAACACPVPARRRGEAGAPHSPPCPRPAPARLPSLLPPLPLAGGAASAPASSSPPRWGWVRSWPWSWPAIPGGWAGPSPDSTWC